MQIKAAGDVTINGFVESAYIESGGDIIITEGAMGKVNDTQGEFQCRLVAAGSIHVQHGQGIQTLYAHMSRFNKKAKKGARVSQGQIIGYVGSSGLASGPHLHYEFRVNGVHKNPVRVKLPEARPIEKKYRKDFLAEADKWLAILESNQQSVLLASAD